MGIAVSYHETVTKLQGLTGTTRGPFDRLEWFHLLEESGARPFVIHAADGNREAALALQLTDNRVESLTNWFSFTWRPVGSGEDFSDEMLASMARELRNRAGCVVLAPVPDEDGTATQLEMAFRSAGWLILREQCDENHVLPVNGRSFDEYWSKRPGKMRTTLKRKGKKVDVEILTHFDENAWAAYEGVYAESWKPQEERSDILEALARSEGNAGRIRLGIARADGVPVAAQFWTVEDGTAYIHKLAHLEAAKRLSAGTTLSAALFEHVIDKDRVDLVDFGTGSDAYKRDWMEVNRPRYRLTCLDWRKPRLWPRIAKALLRRLAPPKAHG